MFSQPRVFVVVGVMVVGLVCAADMGHVADYDPKSAGEESAQERRAYKDDLFSWNYEKVEVASKGWKAHDVRSKVMPVLLKIGGTVYTTVSTALKVKSFVKAANKFVERINRENEYFRSLCTSEPVNVAGTTLCTASTLTLETLSLSNSVTGAITEAYVRTRLNTSNDAFKTATDGMFMLITEAVSTELVMLENFFRMAQKFGYVVVARYFTEPLLVKGTEKDFVKACDNLYAAVSDVLLMSRMVIEHTVSGISSEIKSTTASLAPQFLKYFEKILERGIPREYANSPFPPLSYYWDMSALEQAVSILTDLNVIANQTLNEMVEETASDVIKNSISNVAYVASGSLQDIFIHLKNDKLKATLKSATNGLRMALYAYREAGLLIPTEHGSEALVDKLKSFLMVFKPSSELHPLAHVYKLGSVSGVASLFGVSNKGMELSYKELHDFFLPTDYDHLMTMVTETSKAVTESRIKSYGVGILAAVTGFIINPSKVKEFRLVKRKNNSNANFSGESNLENAKPDSADSKPDTADSKPDTTEHSDIPQPHSLGSMIPSELLLNPNGAKFKKLMNIVLKYGSAEFLVKAQNPVACEADPKCKETFSKIAFEMATELGIDIGPGSLTPLSRPITGMIL